MLLNLRLKLDSIYLLLLLLLLLLTRTRQLDSTVNPIKIKTNDLLGKTNYTLLDADTYDRQLISIHQSLSDLISSGRRSYEITP